MPRVLLYSVGNLPRDQAPEKGDPGGISDDLWLSRAEDHVPSWGNGHEPTTVPAPKLKGFNRVGASASCPIALSY